MTPPDADEVCLLRAQVEAYREQLSAIQMALSDDDDACRPPDQSAEVAAIYQLRDAFAEADLDRARLADELESARLRERRR